MFFDTTKSEHAKAGGHEAIHHGVARHQGTTRGQSASQTTGCRFGVRDMFQHRHAHHHVERTGGQRSRIQEIRHLKGGGAAGRDQGCKPIRQHQIRADILGKARGEAGNQDPTANPHFEHAPAPAGDQSKTHPQAVAVEMTDHRPVVVGQGIELIVGH